MIDFLLSLKKKPKPKPFVKKYESKASPKAKKLVLEILKKGPLRKERIVAKSGYCQEYVTMILTPLTDSGMVIRRKCEDNKRFAIFELKES